MKILMINSFNYLRGGGERCFFDWSDLLRSHGHEVIPSGWIAQESAVGVQ